MKKIIEMLKYIAAFMIIILMLNIFMYMVSLIPKESIKQNVSESVDILYEETNIKKVDLLSKSVFLDNYTDALMLNICYSIDNKMPFESYILSRKNYIPGITSTVHKEESGEVQIDTSKEDYYRNTKIKEEKGIGELKEIVKGNEIQSFEYARYWHGWMIFIRPLLTIMNLGGIRILLTLIIIGLSIWMMILVYKRIDLKSAIIIFLGLLNVDYYLIGFSMQECFVFIIMFISAIIILTNKNTFKNTNLLFFIIGIITNIFDFLTVPIITLAIPLIMHILLKQKEEETHLKQILLDIIKISLIWGVGYILAWISKWLITDIVFDKKTLDIAAKQVLYRSKGAGENFSKTIFLNCNATVSFSLIIIIIFLIKEIINIGRKILICKIKIKNAIPFLIFLIMPLIWYLITNSHSYQHWYFTYRNFSIFYISLCLTITNIKFIKE